jgi:hypothetical protein
MEPKKSVILPFRSSGPDTIVSTKQKKKKVTLHLVGTETMTFVRMAHQGGTRRIQTANDRAMPWRDRHRRGTESIHFIVVIQLVLLTVAAISFTAQLVWLVSDVVVVSSDNARHRRRISSSTAAASTTLLAEETTSTTMMTRPMQYQQQQQQQPRLTRRRQPDAAVTKNVDHNDAVGVDEAMHERNKFTSAAATTSSTAVMEQQTSTMTKTTLSNIIEADPPPPPHDHHNNATMNVVLPTTTIKTSNQTEPQKPVLWIFPPGWGSKEHLAAIAQSVRQREAKQQRAKISSVESYYSTNTTKQKIVVAHIPRCDLLGSFVRPTVFLLAIARRYDWELAILPWEQSAGLATLRHHVALAGAIDRRWGSGIQDVTDRSDYDPVALNGRVYDEMNFFPPVLSLHDAARHEWIQVEHLPEDGAALKTLCQEGRNNRTLTKIEEEDEDDDETCYIQIPDDYHGIEQFVDDHGRLDDFFPLDFRHHLKEKFLSRHMHRLFVNSNNNETMTLYDATAYNVAVHVRRGDLTDPLRWVDQSVYYDIVSAICREKSSLSRSSERDVINSDQVHVHIFSSGRNLDSSWTTLEGLSGESAHFLLVPRLVHFCEVGRKTVGLAHRDPFLSPRLLLYT